MENKKSFISNIVASIKTAVNDFAFRRLKDSGNFDVDQAYWDMKEYGYADLGEYARRSFISNLFAKKAF